MQPEVFLVVSYVRIRKEEAHANERAGGSAHRKQDESIRFLCQALKHNEHSLVGTKAACRRNSATAQQRGIV